MKKEIVIINLLEYITDKVQGLKEDILLEKLSHFQNKNVHLIICHFVENYCWGHDIYSEKNYDLPVLDNLRKILKNKNLSYHLLFDALYEGLHKIDHTDDIIFVNYGMLLTYDYIFLKNNNFNFIWKPMNKKGLFLVGKGLKAHRAFLLRRIYEEGLLEEIDWSFNNNIIELDFIKKSPEFADYTDVQWNVFLKTCKRNLDLSDEMIEQKSFFGHNGYPVDPKLYNDTSFSLVSETLYDYDIHRLGEKTWRTMLNHHPFLMAGCYRNLLQLRRMGFKTFDNYAEFKQYDLEKDGSERLELIVKNLRTFANNLEQNKDEVYKDVKHNYYKLIEYCRLYVDRITTTLNVNEDFISDLIYKFALR